MQGHGGSARGQGSLWFSVKVGPEFCGIDFVKSPASEEPFISIASTKIDSGPNPATDSYNQWMHQRYNLTKVNRLEAPSLSARRFHSRRSPVKA